ncbi:MAG: methyl-accepting chemotaxis protein [Lachnospiraceae bacterium]|nr:methyl-accepting chemotaxis protein [Lachnospiraceae bacterium]
MKVKMSLIMGYGVTILISLIFIIVCFVAMSNQKGQYDELLAKDVAANEQILYARMNANIAARNVRDLLLSPNGANNAQLESGVSNALAEMEGNLQGLEAAWPDGVSTASLDAYRASVNAWKNIASEIMNMYRAGRVYTGTELVNTQCSPALNAMADYGAEVDQILVASMRDRVASIDRSIKITTIVLVVAMIIAASGVMAFVFVLIRSITVPTEQVRRALVGFSQGKLDIPVDYESKNELGEMCDALRTSQEVLNAVIADTGYLLGEMAHGNFNIRTRAEDKYVGALTTMLQSMRTINCQLSDTLHQITLSAEQVSSGSDQVASGAQMLAQGATEQASSVEELSATISNISVQVNNTAKNSTNAMEEVHDTGSRVAACNEQMTQMTNAMEEITSKSNEISKIVKSIEDIAFQTNILALNAAVEAARAGDAGKGFAVVADEVRSLAAKSAEASQNTSVLIGDTVDAVKRGTKVVNETAETLKYVVEGTQRVSHLVMNITQDAQREASALTQVSEGIDQISSVVSTTSATSEESAAASEELSSQANLIRELMSKFRLRSVDDSASYDNDSYDDAYSTSSSYGSYDEEMDTYDDSYDDSYGYTASAADSGRETASYRFSGDKY